MFLADADATMTLGARLAALARPGDVFCLSGDLGSGKTTLARGFLRACGVAGEVPSPTFNLVLTYDARLPDGTGVAVWHVDLYRLEDPAELAELGLEEALADGILLVEWPDRLGAWRPDDAVEVTLATEGAGRRATIAGNARFADLR